MRRCVLGGRSSTINIGGLSFLIADPNPHSAAIIYSILRGFGATRIVDTRTIQDTIQILIDQKIDMLLIDPQLAQGRGLEFIRNIRQDPHNPCRTMPILVVTGDTRTSAVKAAKDAGANMVVAKPVSPSNLYERLTWVAFNPKSFAEPADGAEPRSKTGGTNNPTHADAAALSQNQVDNLFQETRVSGS